jgi:hypothetical protein
VFGSGDTRAKLDRLRSLAGFIEPAESLDEAVKREIWVRSETVGPSPDSKADHACVHFHRKKLYVCLNYTISLSAYLYLLPTGDRCQKCDLPLDPALGTFQQSVISFSQQAHSIRRWQPFPGSLMIGAFAQATNVDIRTDLDNELEGMLLALSFHVFWWGLLITGLRFADARWVSREAVLGALSNEKQTTLTQAEANEMHAKYGSNESSGHALAEERQIRLPPKTVSGDRRVASFLPSKSC